MTTMAVENGKSTGNIVELAAPESLDAKLIRVDGEIDMRTALLPSPYHKHLLGQLKKIHEPIKDQLIEFKIYLGSEIEHVIGSDHIKMKATLANPHVCTPEKCIEISNMIITCTLEEVQSIMRMEKVGFQHSGGAFEHDRKRINLPLPKFIGRFGGEVQKDQSLPKILILVELVSLMIVKQELLAEKKIQALQNVVAPKQGAVTHILGQ